MDFIGLLLNVGTISNNVKSINKMRLSILLGDQNLNQISLTIWSQALVKQVETDIINMEWKFSQKSPCILAVKMARTCDYSDQRSLNLSNEARIFINPDLPEAHMLARWIQEVDPKHLAFQNVQELKL